MILAARFLCQPQIALYRPPLALGAYAPVAVQARILPAVDVSAPQQRIILAVGGDHLAYALRFGHRAAHKLFALHSPAVIREGYAIRRKARHIGQLLAPLADGYRRIRVNAYHRIPLDYIYLLLYIFYVVGHGIQIRHGADIGISPVRRRKRAAFDRFFIKKSRLSEMHMHITESRKNISIVEI